MIAYDIPDWVITELRKVGIYEVVAPTDYNVIVDWIKLDARGKELADAPVGSKVELDENMRPRLAKPKESDRTPPFKFDGSRHRYAAAIADRYMAGEPVESLADDYGLKAFEVERLLAAYSEGWTDREDQFDYDHDPPE